MKCTIIIVVSIEQHSIQFEPPTVFNTINLFSVNKRIKGNIILLILPTIQTRIANIKLKMYCVIYGL